ncbi:MAG: membrane protein insertase YidC [Pseudomonadales bacterium]
MDKQRLVLFSAMAVIVYLLILAWNDDYGTPAEPAVAQTQQQLSGNTQLVDSLPSGENQVTSDLPTVTAADDSVPTATAQPVIQAQPSQKTIEVKTDVFSISINTRGGDIVYAGLNEYPRIIDKKDDPFLLLQNSGDRVFVAQSGLIGKNGPDSSKTGRPIYQTAQQVYTMDESEDSLTVDLLLNKNGVSITKRFTFTRGDYLINVEYLVNNQSSQNWQGRFFAQLKRDNSSDPSKTTSMGMASFLGAATQTTDDNYVKVDFDDVDDDPFKEKNSGGWIAILQHYFVTVWVPNENQQHTFEVRKNSQGENIAGLVSPATNVAPGDTATFGAELYAGPKFQKRLGEISSGLELTVDYGFLFFIGQPLFWLLTFFHSFIGNWGWSIILTTVVIKLVFFPLSAASYRSMANMRRVGPEMARIKDQHGSDRQKMSSAMMELYKKEKINPLGGCLPILVQMPVFIALYWVLMESVELRQAPFMFWLTDLSIKDPFFVLPILMGITMFCQQMLNPTPPDPTQAKVMKMMPIMFTFFFLWFPSGLVLYWVSNNLLSIAQQYVITKKIENATASKELK